MTKQEFNQFNDYLIGRGTYIEHPILGRLIRNPSYDEDGNVTLFQAVRDYDDYQLFVDVFPSPLRTLTHICFNRALTFSPNVLDSIAEEARALCNKILGLIIDFYEVVLKKEI